MRIKPTQKPVQRQKPVRSPEHLNFIRSLPCLTCGPWQHYLTEAAHVNYSDADSGKFNMRGRKADDCWVVPLCRSCHAQQHSQNERAFWEYKHIDPLPICMNLWRNSGDVKNGIRIVLNAYERRKQSYIDAQFDDGET